jgi:hypothetical protein
VINKLSKLDANVEVRGFDRTCHRVFVTCNTFCSVRENNFAQESVSVF